jgi:hypothetical protein
MDATCAPADIAHPSDLRLVEHARQLTERILDEARMKCGASDPRPRTQSETCRRRYLEAAKQRRCKPGKLRKTLRKLLNAVRRNLAHIRACEGAALLPARRLRTLETVERLHGQQRRMLEEGTRSVECRIVSIQQPHVRPIVRGKAGRPVEFGAKLTASLTAGYARLERLDWEAYNEGGDLPGICERHRERTGAYPEAVLADKIFRTRANLAWCARRGIRLSGPRLGRPPKEGGAAQLRQQRADGRARNAIEGKFGQCKRRLGMDRVMAVLQGGSETAIHLSLLAANLTRWMRAVAMVFLRLFFPRHFPHAFPQPPALCRQCSISAV